MSDAKTQIYIHVPDKVLGLQLFIEPISFSSFGIFPHSYPSSNLWIRYLAFLL